MWNLLEKITEQVTRYCTMFGLLWYILVFIFRLIVVVTLGGAVYSDEQSTFKCVTSLSYCTNICFNDFSKISHLRFWGFQILAITFPVVTFHLFTTYVTGQVEKIKMLEKRANVASGESQDMTFFDNNSSRNTDLQKITRKRKAVGKVKQKTIYTNGELKEIPFTTEIHIAYYISVVARIVLEIVFIYLAYTLYTPEDPSCTYPGAKSIFENPVCHFSFLNHVLMPSVPTTFICKANAIGFEKACNQHIGGLIQHASVTCFTSRPFEKTIFIRYMNILSFVCALLCGLELIFIPLRFLIKSQSRTHYNTNGIIYPNTPLNNYPNQPPPMTTVAETSMVIDYAEKT